MSWAELIFLAKRSVLVNYYQKQSRKFGGGALDKVKEKLIFFSQTLTFKAQELQKLGTILGQIKHFCYFFTKKNVRWGKLLKKKFLRLL